MRIQKEMSFAGWLQKNSPTMKILKLSIFASFVGSILPKKEKSLYGLVLAAGGDMSYLVGNVAHQMLMTHNRMIALPRVLYAGKDWKQGQDLTEDLSDRIDQFCEDFYELGGKLI